MFKGFKENLSSIFSKQKIDQTTLNEFEELLIQSDIDIATSEEIVKKLNSQNFSKGFSISDIQSSLERIILEILKPCEKQLDYETSENPYVLLVMGVNGSGKTTTIAKIANNFIQKNKKILLVAADTFRAAASEQLEEWAKKLESNIIKGEVNSDPASIVFKSIEQAKSNHNDVIIIDTAGRLQNRIDLMDQLGKMDRVLKKHNEIYPHETIIIIDSTTGQNALKQVEEFNKYSKISGIILTKYDTGASGGTLISIAKKTRLPIVAIGNGEKIGDLIQFDAKKFSKNIIEKN